jgi:SAM-dependent methyltransferase
VTAGPGGYNPAHFEKLFAIEERHFWFRARANVIRALARKSIASLAPGYRVLEVGCGTGNVLRTLREACREGLVVGLDRFAEGLQFARMRNPETNLVQADAFRFPFSRGFHLIGCFDVLEHISEDRQVLAALFSMLEASGKLLITVPAHMGLWSDFDIWSGHCRRYTVPELKEKLESAGFSVDFISEFMASTLPLIWVARRMRPSGAGDAQSITGRASRELKVIPVVNRLLLAILRFEGRWIGALKRLPAGSSIVALATRRPPPSTV